MCTFMCARAHTHTPVTLISLCWMFFFFWISQDKTSHNMLVKFPREKNWSYCKSLRVTTSREPNKWLKHVKLSKKLFKVQWGSGRGLDMGLTPDSESGLRMGWPVPPCRWEWVAWGVVTWLLRWLRRATCEMIPSMGNLFWDHWGQIVSKDSCIGVKEVFLSKKKCVCFILWREGKWSGWAPSVLKF